MSRLSITWFQFWKKRKLLYSLFLVLAIACLTFGATFLQVYEDITKTLPQSATFEKLKTIVEHRGLNSSIYLSIGDQKEWDSETVKAYGDEFCDDLSSESKGVLKNLKFGIEEDERAFFDFISERFPFYLNDSDYVEVERRLQDTTLVSRIKTNHQKLFTPEGFLLKDFLINDPIGLSTMALSKFKSLQDEAVFDVQDGLFRMQDDGSLFITGDVDFPEEEGAVDREELITAIESVAKKWEDKGFEVEYFSTFLIADANAQQIKRDTQLTLTVSLVGIILLLLIYYRSFFLPLFFILPAVLGLLFSVGLIFLFRPEVSALSLGAGAVVLGIIMDYSFHFFTHLKHSGSVEETLEDVTNPLLTGCLTTILAFLALTFTDSPVLQDFGLFAALSLIGAAFSVILVLPIFLPKWLIDRWQNRKEKEFKLKIGKGFRIATTIGIIGFSVLAFFYVGEIQFDDDLMNLNHYPEDLQKSELRFRQMDPDKERSVLALSTHPSQSEANAANGRAYERLKQLQSEGAINNVISTAVFDVAPEKRAMELQRWNAFCLETANRTPELLDSMEEVLGYFETAFDPFKNKIDGKYLGPENPTAIPLASSDLEKLVDSTHGEWTYITVFTVPINKQDSVLNVLQNDLKVTEIFSKAEMAGSLVAMVQSDFNFILITSSILVFLTLLFIYGRIELALITFLPMILSWVWILAIAALLQIEFNFVNIVISTFIFGLGDDFAIFITDGFTSNYSKGKDILGTYKKGILLSASTTIIGTGALLFAVHPALNSVALISVVGMVAILIISFTVQPWLLRRIMTNRKKKGLPPVSLANFIFTTFCWVFFLSGCLALFPLQLLFRILPFGQKRLKLFYHYLMRAFAWMQIHFMLNTQKRIVNRKHLDFSKPSVIVVNHQSAIDVIMVMSLHPKMVIMTNDWVYNSPFFGAQIRYLGFFPGSNGVEQNLEAVKPWVENGYSVVLFPEGTRAKNKKIGRFHKGAFYIAEKLKLDISPIILHGFNDTMKKGDLTLLNGKMSLVALPRIKSEDETWGTTYRERQKSISRYFKEEFRNYDIANTNHRYLQHKILSNYIYRSPFIEWYVKVKWWFERKNFDHYHQLIPNEGRVYDLGCGYGYLSYFLYFCSEDRQLIGMDYDEEKINIANNCYSKNDHLEFVSGDIRDLSIENASAIFINDVMHYLPAEDHEKMLHKCLNNLHPEGVLLIRDGVTDLNNRHKRTEQTEKYSTQIIGFNKTVNQLCFFSKAFILDFAEKNNLHCEVHEQSQKTSNILFVLKRK